MEIRRRQSDFPVPLLQPTIQMPLPTTPCVLHYYEGPAGTAAGFFICPVGHRFKCEYRKVARCAERYGSGWALLCCVSCSPLIAMYTDARGDIVNYLTQFAIVPPDTEPRSLYRSPPAAISSTTDAP